MYLESCQQFLGIKQKKQVNLVMIKIKKLITQKVQLKDQWVRLKKRTFEKSFFYTKKFVRFVPKSPF